MQNQLETTFSNCRICLKGTLDCIRNFCNKGLFVSQRSQHYWASDWPDLTIEKVSMLAIKIKGGLTPGSVFTESAHNRWIYSMR